MAPGTGTGVNVTLSTLITVARLLKNSKSAWNHNRRGSGIGVESVTDRWIGKGTSMPGSPPSLSNSYSDVTTVSLPSTSATLKVSVSVPSPY